MTIEHLNPESMHSNPAYTQVVSVKRATQLLFVGGQDGILADGTLAGPDLRTQTRQALRNVLEALKAGGASQEHVVKLNVYIVQGQDVREGYAAAQEVWGAHATALTVLTVTDVGIPGALVEIDAIAALDDDA